MTNLQDIFTACLTEKQVQELSPVALAFIGDGVHTMYVRDKVIKQGSLTVNDYHKKSASFCNAKAQSKLLDKVLPSLLEGEQDIVRRARNAKIHHTSKNSDEATYKKATSFEALIGYLYLVGNYDRIKQILSIEVN